jgi:hypothetical protein
MRIDKIAQFSQNYQAAGDYFDGAVQTPYYILIRRLLPAILELILRLKGFSRYPMPSAVADD